MISSFLPVLTPECLLALGGTGALVVGVFQKHRAFLYTSLIAFLLLIFALLQMPHMQATVPVALKNMIHTNHSILLAKWLAGAGCAWVIFLSLQATTLPFELALLLLFSTLGVLVMLSANNFLLLYLGLELQSLSAYILTSIRRNHSFSSEGGLKYLILGALSSGIMLYGISFIYGFSGTIHFDALQQLTGSSFATMPMGLMVGIILVLIGILFKLSLVPFHMWTLDVYQGAHTMVTAFLSIVPKVGPLIVLAHLLTIGETRAVLQDTLWLVAMLSMLIGAIGGLRQSSLKRLLGYSTINHSGTMLIGIIATATSGLTPLFFYLTLYIVLSIGLFACLVCVEPSEEEDITFYHIQGLGQSQPMLAWMITILLLSMAGIPPCAGFFMKLSIFMSAIEAGYMSLALVGVVSSVIAAYYYLKMIHTMFFLPPQHVPPVKNGTKLCKGVAWIAVLIHGLFFLMPNTLMDAIHHAL